jgi:outer membrane protein assembly factor BamB
MRRLIGTAAAVVLVLTSLGQAQRASTDVTQWRGPNRDGVVQGFTAPQAWPETLVKRWTVEVGTGYATPLVVGNRVFVFSRLGENETMTALDGDSGKVVWQQSYPAPFAMNPATKAHGPGPKSTPVYFNGRLYSIGMTGVVTAWDAASGKQVWQKPGTGVAMEYTSHSFSPLVEAGRVIFHVGARTRAR